MIRPEELECFCELLRALLSDDNQLRGESERLYEETKRVDPDRLCRCLITVLTQVPFDIQRQQSAVLLRQCLKSTRSDFVWPSLLGETQEAIKAQLVIALRNEQVRSVQHKVCDVVSTLASHVLDLHAGPAGWPAIGEALSDLAEVEDGGRRASALRVFRDMLAANPQVAHSVLLGRVPRILELCRADVSSSAQKETVLFFAAVLEHLPPSVWEPLRKQVVPLMLAALQRLESSEDELHECLQALAQVADVSPGALQLHIDSFFRIAFAVCHAHGQFGDEVRRMAFEFIVSFCEKRSKMCAKLPDFVGHVVHLCMEFMLEVDGEEKKELAWSEELDARGPIDISNYDVGEENLDRFARALGAEAILDQVFANVRQFVNTDSWKHKYVAIMSLSQCAEIVEQESHVDEIVKLLVAMLPDAHPRVRYAALHAIGQISTDHSPYLQEQHHELLLPVLSRLMDDPVVRVASHACAAFINFAEDLECDILLPHLPNLMGKLSMGIVAESRLAREQSITAVAVIAGVVKAHFVPYYQHVVHVMKQVVLTATSKEERTLRGKAFECMSLLGLSVGRDVFGSDAQEAMQAMMETASRGLDADDPQRSYIHEAAQRICRALKEDFLPYLQYLLPGIYSMLQMQPVEVVDPDAEEDMTIDFLESGKAVGLKTSQIEDFRSAMQMLNCFLEVLGGHFFDHVQESARCLLQALSFRFSSDVKREAISTWRELICAAKAGLAQREVAEEALVAELFGAFLRTTLEAMRTEQDIELLIMHAQGIAESLRAAGPGTLAPSEVQVLCAELRRLIDESTKRQRDTMAAAENLTEDDQAEAEQWRDADVMLRMSYAQVAGAVMEMYKAHFLSGGLQHFVPIMQEYLSAGQGVPERCLALYLVDDIMEKLGRDGVVVWPVFMTQMLESIEDEDAWIRQAAAYGVAYAARIEEFGQFAEQAGRLLAQLVAHPEAKNKENVEATEAAVAALGSLCRWQASHIKSIDHYLVLWLGALPLVHDLEHAGPTHELLMAFVKEGHPIAQSHGGKACRVFLEVYNREVSTEALNQDIRRVFREAGEEKLRHLQLQLSEKQKKKIQKIMRDAKQQNL